MRKINGIQHLHLVSFSDSCHRRCKIARTIDGKNRRFIKGRSKKCRCQMAPVMFYMVNF